MTVFIASYFKKMSIKNPLEMTVFCILEANLLHFGGQSPAFWRAVSCIKYKIVSHVLFVDSNFKSVHLINQCNFFISEQQKNRYQNVPHPRWNRLVLIFHQSASNPLCHDPASHHGMLSVTVDQVKKMVIWKQRHVIR